jgi:hypothetical protein
MVVKKIVLWSMKHKLKEVGSILVCFRTPWSDHVEIEPHGS